MALVPTTSSSSSLLPVGFNAFDDGDFIVDTYDLVSEGDPEFRKYIINDTTVMAKAMAEANSSATKPPPSDTADVVVSVIKSFAGKAKDSQKAYRQYTCKLLYVERHSEITATSSAQSPKVLYMKPSPWISWPPVDLAEDPNNLRESLQYTFAYLDTLQTEKETAAAASKSGLGWKDERIELLESANISSYCKQTYLPDCTYGSIPRYAPHHPPPTEKAAAKKGGTSTKDDAKKVVRYLPLKPRDQLKEIAERSLKNSHVATTVVALLSLYRRSQMVTKITPDSPLVLFHNSTECAELDRPGIMELGQFRLSTKIEPDICIPMLDDTKPPHLRFTTSDSYQYKKMVIKVAFPDQIPWTLARRNYPFSKPLPTLDKFIGLDDKSDERIMPVMIVRKDFLERAIKRPVGHCLYYDLNSMVKNDKGVYQTAATASKPESICFRAISSGIQWDRLLVDESEDVKPVPGSRQQPGSRCVRFTLAATPVFIKLNIWDEQVGNLFGLAFNDLKVNELFYPILWSGVDFIAHMSVVDRESRVLFGNQAQLNLGIKPEDAAKARAFIEQHRVAGSGTAQDPTVIECRTLEDINYGRKITLSGFNSPKNKIILGGNAKALVANPSTAIKSVSFPVSKKTAIELISRFSQTSKLPVGTEISSHVVLVSREPKSGHSLITGMDETKWNFYAASSYVNINDYAKFPKLTTRHTDIAFSAEYAEITDNTETVAFLKEKDALIIGNVDCLKQTSIAQSLYLVYAIHKDIALLDSEALQVLGEYEARSAAAEAAAVAQTAHLPLSIAPAACTATEDDEGKKPLNRKRKIEIDELDEELVDETSKPPEAKRRKMENHELPFLTQPMDVDMESIKEEGDGEKGKEAEEEEEEEQEQEEEQEEEQQEQEEEEDLGGESQFN